MPRLPVTEAEGGASEESERFLSDADVDELLIKETSVVNQRTENLLSLLKEKKMQLESLRELDDVENNSVVEGGSD